MRSVWNRSAAIGLLSASLVSCDSTGPNPAELTSVLLDYCAADVPVFVAVQNEGTDWEQVIPNAEGTIAFDATPTFSMAIVHLRGGRTVTEYISAGVEDIQPLYNQACIDQAGTKALNGTVANVPLGSGAVVTMAGSAAFLTAPTATFSLTDLPNGPYDLIAHREFIGTSSVQPDRVFVRRAQDRANGSAIPVLDFASSEALPSVPHVVTATGLSGADINEFLLTFSTPTTRRHSLSLREEFTSSTRTVYGIPSSLTQTGDFHELEVFADAGAAYRGEVQYYRIPGNRTVALGAHLNDPTLTFLPSTTQLRPRTQLQSQFEYGGFVSVFLRQTTRDVVITVTNSFYGGTPINWDISAPDLSSMPGFPTSARLQAGQSTEWYVEGYNGSPSAFFGSPADGETLHFAGRSFETSGAVASLRVQGMPRTPVTERRPRLGAH